MTDPRPRSSVRLSDNTIFSLSDLPAKDTVRWVASRKLTVVRAVAYGLLSEAEAKSIYSLSDEEFSSWVRHASTDGLNGLKVTLRKKELQPKVEIQ